MLSTTCKGERSHSVIASVQIRYIKKKQNRQAEITYIVISTFIIYVLENAVVAPYYRSKS